LTRSLAIRINIAAAVIAAAVIAAATSARDRAEDMIRDGRRALDDGRVAEAESTFARAAAVSEGDTRAEALFLQAGLVRSGADAEALYRRILESESPGRWSDAAAMELAKIEFAMGRYEGARSRLRDASLCDRSEEACLFEGLASVMLNDPAGAIPALERVRKGRARAWAMLGIAAAEESAGRAAEACARYESLARARVSPAAWYRHAECLEKQGDAPGARREFTALAEAFPQTPEAVRSLEKIMVPAQSTPPAPPSATTVPPSDAARGSGFTIQFGSFGDRGNAIKLAAKIKKTQPGVRIDSELVDYREVFRVRIGHYTTREKAQAAAEAISRDVEEPFTIMPVGGARR
jgi:tetratricopeptide (TPR) repeat protein